MVSPLLNDTFDFTTPGPEAKIRRLRKIILALSVLYYERDQSAVPDWYYDTLSVELAFMQTLHPQVECPLREAFADWTGETGAFLPFNEGQHLADVLWEAFEEGNYPPYLAGKGSFAVDTDEQE